MVSRSLSEKRKKQLERARVLPVADRIEQLAGEGPTRNPLAAYLVKPKGFSFEAQDQEEKIIMLLRRHMVTNVGWLVMTAILVLIPVLLVLVEPLMWLPARFQIMLLIGYYMLVTAFVLENFLSWYFNVYLITDERIIDVDFYSLLYKSVSATKIENIQDVTYEMAGVAGTVFNYGTVYIQTAGEVREFDFGEVPNPDRVVKILNEMMLEEEQEKIEGRVR